MFLKKLYNFNKLLFTAFVVFIVIQLFLNFKQGLTVIPFMHMGMYSSALNIQPEISVVEVFVNGKPLEATNYNASTWDQVMLPLQAYCNQQQNGLRFYQNDIKRLLAAFKIPSHESTFVTPVSTEDFTAKYNAYISKLLELDADSIEIRRATYRYLQVDNTARYIKISSSNFFEQCK